MAHDVFISHSSTDKAVADAVCAGLEAEKIRCWIAPRDILPGMDWGEAIIDAIEGSIIMVLILSSISNKSEQVKHEIQNAVDVGIPVLPIRIEELELSKSMRFFLGTQHWLDAVTPPMEQHIKLLAEKVQVLLSKISHETTPKYVETPPQEIDDNNGKTLYNTEKLAPETFTKVIINAEELKDYSRYPRLNGFYFDEEEPIFIHIYCNKDMISIGRGPFNDLVIIDSTVSRKHCCIKRENDIYKLIDLKSTFGTFINKIKITEQELNNGDIIKIGSLELTFMEDRNDFPDNQNQIQISPTVKPNFGDLFKK